MSVKGRSAGFFIRFIMKINSILCFAILFFAGTAFSQSTDKRIDDIRERYLRVNGLIAESEKEPEYSSIFLTEIVVNKNNGSYPAVGAYNSTVKFYYTFGDREKNPYPDRLLKIVVSTKRSARIESMEYLFDEIGKLIFCFEKSDDRERRMYFNSGRLIRFSDGELVSKSAGTNETNAAKTAIDQLKKLEVIFKNSL